MHRSGSIGSPAAAAAAAAAGMFRLCVVNGCVFLFFFKCEMQLMSTICFEKVCISTAAEFVSIPSLLLSFHCVAYYIISLNLIYIVF